MYVSFIYNIYKDKLVILSTSYNKLKGLADLGRPSHYFIWNVFAGCPLSI